MNRFLKFDSKLGIYRIPLTYSLGDLDTIRRIFGEYSIDASIALPKLPPLRDIIDELGNKGYLIYPLYELSPKIIDFLEKTVIHVRELKGKNYDIKNPLFKNYLQAREECIEYLAQHLESAIAQERRLGIFNLFWLAITKQIILCLEKVLVTSGGNIKLRFNIHPHLKSMLNQVQELVNEKLNYKDDLTRKKIPFFRGTLKSKLGANFNFNFVNDMINVQLSLLESSISPLDPLFQIRRILIDENSEYYIEYKDFKFVYDHLKLYIEENIKNGDEWVLSLLAHVFGIPLEKIPEINIHTILFEPQVIFLIQEELKRVPVSKGHRGIPLRRKTLFDEIGPKVWSQVLLDYIKLAREFQKAEIFNYFRDKIIFLDTDMWRTEAVLATNMNSIKNRITYNFNSDSIINDLRKVAIIFIDLRGFTEVASSIIPTKQLRESLYSFFDPTLDIIEHFGGTIRFFAGDAILATFGEDSAQKDGSLNAVRAGILIQRLLKELVEEKKLPFQGVGVGIHLGQIENVYIFKSAWENIDTVIGLSANIASRLSSGKSITSERKGDPTMLRELMDMMQDILETVKNRVSPNLRKEIAEVSQRHIRKYTGESGLDTYQPLPQLKHKPGEFKVHILGGVLHNNGVALSEDSFREIQSSSTLETRPTGEKQEFILMDKMLDEKIAFKQVGQALFKGMESPISVWSAVPVKA